MDIQIFNEDGTPKLDENGRFVYEEIIPPDWIGFRTAFSLNRKWIEYANNNPYMAGLLSLLAMQQDPDINTINNMLQFSFAMVHADESDKQQWQLISDQYNVKINFVKK